MIELGSANAQICVIGRTDFATGIGAVTYAAAELLSRHYPVSMIPTDRPGYEGAIELPNGRRVPVSEDPAAIKAFVFTDVLWNGAYDTNYLQVPEHGLRIAHIAYDSDELPSRWVDILNARFDIALFSSQHLEAAAVSSGVRIPVSTLPIALEIESLLSRPWQPPAAGVVRFGSIASFHERKGIATLARSFIAAFGSDKSVELVLHSNLAMGDEYSNVMRLAEGYDNIRVSHANLSAAEKTELIDTFDFFVSCSRGEGYSIGPREALALGKGLILSEIGAHRDLFGVGGVIGVPTTVRVPARYPEIDNQIFGHQYAVEEGNVCSALRRAVTLARNSELAESRTQRRDRAAEFAFSKLSTDYAEVINPTVRRFRTNASGSAFTNLKLEARQRTIDAIGPNTGSLACANRTVVPAHDGGFFSVFNAFMSHLAWDLDEDRCHLVLPDWDVARLIDRVAPSKPVSFCYGQPEDGNIWLKLFEPLYELTDAEMNDERTLYHNARVPERVHNDDREPLLTYIHAFELYRRPSFAHIRRQYNRVVRDHIRLRGPLANGIDRFCDDEFGDKLMIAAHVKHPSHVMEQPDSAMAEDNRYLEAVYEQLAMRSVAKSSTGWGVFLATDQDRVVNLFREEFGDRLAYFPDVRRTSELEDGAYSELDAASRGQEGHQVQHLVAADRSKWSIRMAEEVIRDMIVMSRCAALLHVVSNVSTAASYFNPDLDLVFMR